MGMMWTSDVALRCERRGLSGCKDGAGRVMVLVGSLRNGCEILEYPRMKIGPGAKETRGWLGMFGHFACLEEG